MIFLGDNRDKRNFCVGVLFGIFGVHYYLHILTGSVGSSTTKKSFEINNGMKIPGQQDRMYKYYQKYRYIAPAQDGIYGKHSEYYRTLGCGKAPDFGAFFKLDKHQRSRLDEDKFIYETFFRNKTVTNGTYVELGAYDGIQESNSRFFDKCLGWKGLLIEGNPENYQDTIRSRPFAHKMSFAPSCDAAYEAENKTIEFYKYPMANGGLKEHALTYKGRPTVDVPCGPLSPVLEDIFSGDEHINFFSLDVEGAERLVLDTIDFEEVRIDVFMIEIENFDCKPNRACEVRNQVRDKMKREGYNRYEGLVQASDIYVHPGSDYQIPESVAKPLLRI